MPDYDGYVFDNEPCMFFVGGNDNKANNAAAGGVWGEAGGCTKEWWDTELGGLTIDDGQDYIDAATAAMGKLMNADGSPIWNEPSGAKVINMLQSEWIIVEKNGVGENDFIGVEVGMLCYLDEGEENLFLTDNGIYKIMEVENASPPTWIRIEGDELVAHIDDVCDLWIGGAFTDVSEVAEEINCDSYSQQILCNKDKTNVPATTVSNWGHGDAAKNTWLCIHGFNRVPYDIVNPAGVYYQCVKDAFDNGAVADSFVKFGNGSLNDTLFDMNEVENIHFEGFRFIGTGGANVMFRSTVSSSENHIFKHCLIELDGACWAFFYYSQSHRIIFEDCSFIGVPSYRNLLTTSGVIYLRNVVMRGDPAMIMNDNSNETVILSHVIMIDGSRQINMSTTGGQIFAMDSTFIDCTYGEFFLGGGAGNPVFCGLFGNIHKLLAADDFVVIMRDAAYPVSAYISNDVVWSEEGQVTAIGWNTKTDAEDPIVYDVIEVDPALDVNLYPTNKTLREYGPFGQWKWLGAIQVIPDLPDVANVTDDDTVDDEPGTYHETQENEVAAGITFGEGGTEYTGTRTELVPPSPSGDVEAAGETSKAMAALKDMLSESATFQDAIGATGDEAAKKAWALSRIHLAEYQRDDDEEDTGGFVRPFGLIMTPGGDTGRAIATGQFANSGMLDLWVEQEIAEAYQPAGQEHNAEMYFKNFLDGITSDCAALSSQAGYLMIQSMTMPEGPGRIDEKNVKVYACRIAVAWGLE